MDIKIAQLKSLYEDLEEEVELASADPIKENQQGGNNNPSDTQNMSLVPIFALHAYLTGQDSLTPPSKNELPPPPPMIALLNFL